MNKDNIKKIIRVLYITHHCIGEQFKKLQRDSFILTDTRASLDLREFLEIYSAGNDGK